MSNKQSSARRVLLGLALLAGLASAGSALAQNWPTKPVTVVVPWPPGGPSDTAARPVAKGLNEALGKAFVIDNRGGAGGNIGSALVAKADPDGHTLLITSSAPIVINPHVYRKMPYDPPKDLAPVTNLLRVPLVLVVHPSVPAKNLQELVAHIKAQQGKFQYASSGNGTPQHLTGELFKTVGKLDSIHVPYKGSAPAINDLLGGQVPMMFDSTVAIVPHIKAGKVKAIAVTSAKRSPLLPDVPTFAEAGMPDMESYAWYGMFAPAKTPKDIVAKLNAETIKVMKGKDYQRVLAETGSDFVGDTPEKFAAFVKAEHEKWGKIAKATGATID
jgi:tripartite-type tricarboxylate transporter receptor subunit TctC